MKAAPILLLVDDSGDEVALALRALRRLDRPIEVRTAHNGREALAALHVRGPSRMTHPLRPCVIFLDLCMPDVDGFEVLRALRSTPHTRAIPVVMLSSSSSPEDVRRAYELGANSYLVKRPGAPDAGALIAEAAHYWIDLNLLATAG